MKRCVLLLVLLMICGFSSRLAAQEISDLKADKILKDRQEVCFNIFNVDRPILGKLSKMISVDKVKGETVFAYANRKEFSRFLEIGLKYELVKAPGIVGNVTMQDQYSSKSTNAWDAYPTYPAYEAMMNQFVTDFPDICQLITIGTLNSGRKLLAIKISANPDSVMNKPRFLYSSSMHGDEITGYVNMLRLIDYLLHNYSTNTRVTNMINNIDIYINPLANPDGTYHGGNTTVNGSTRGNANGIDLNRNYPDPADGPHPDGENWQPETVAFMAFASQYNINMSANFHGGAEVINYPWDTYSQVHTDNDFWIHVSRAWVDTVHLYSPSNYLTDLNNGITNGYAWYRITGGRQDYMTYFQFGREFTMEISSIKLVPAASLPNYWNYNYRSFLNYIEESLYGVRGIVTDSVTGAPLKAKVFISGHDFDSSFIYSRLPIGDYYRYLPSGNFNITYSCPGYYPKTLTAVNSAYHVSNVKDVKLVPIGSGINDPTFDAGISVYPNPAKQFAMISLNRLFGGNCELKVINTIGEVVMSEKIQGDKLNNQYPLDLSTLSKGLYILTLSNGSQIASGKIVIE